MKRPCALIVSSGQSSRESVESRVGDKIDAMLIKPLTHRALLQALRSFELIPPPKIKSNQTLIPKPSAEPAPAYGA